MGFGYLDTAQFRCAMGYLVAVTSHRYDLGFASIFSQSKLSPIGVTGAPDLSLGSNVRSLRRPGSRSRRRQCKRRGSNSVPAFDMTIKGRR
jgi:hypothetical protein